MPNEIIFIFELILSFSLVLLVYKFFSIEGLKAWMVFACIIANIQVCKNIRLFSIVSTLGNPLYSSCFLATDIISENHNDRDAKGAVLVSFLFMIFCIVFMQITLFYTADVSDKSQRFLEGIFSLFPRVVFASLISYLISNFLDIYLFSYIREKQENKPWLRNNVATLISQALDTFIFTSLSFYKVYPNDVLFQIMLSTYVFKALGALLDTPFFYLSKKIKPLQLLSTKNKS